MTKLEPLPYRRGDGEDIERVGEDGAPPDWRWTPTGDQAPPRRWSPEPLGRYSEL